MEIQFQFVAEQLLQLTVTTEPRKVLDFNLEIFRGEEIAPGKNLVLANRPLNVRVFPPLWAPIDHICAGVDLHTLLNIENKQHLLCG